MRRVADGGWLRGATVREFGSPHGGSWLPLLTERGFTAADTADVVLDCFGIMREADQRVAFRRRCAATSPGGVLLMQLHSLLTIVEQGQWTSLRHGHFAYYSLTALRRLLAGVGISVAASWEFALYGGTVLVAAVHGHCEPDAGTSAILDREKRFGITEPTVVEGLQREARIQADALRNRLESARAAGRTVHAYGASSRAVALLCLAGVDGRLLPVMADASPAKQGRRMPGTDIGSSRPKHSSPPNRTTSCSRCRTSSTRSRNATRNWTVAGGSTGLTRRQTTWVCRPPDRRGHGTIKKTVDAALVDRPSVDLQGSGHTFDRLLDIARGVRRRWRKDCPRMPLRSISWMSNVRNGWDG